MQRPYRVGSSVKRFRYLRSFPKIVNKIAVTNLYQVSLISHNKSAIFSHLKMTSAVSQEIHFLAVYIAHQARQGLKSVGF